MLVQLWKNYKYWFYLLLGIFVFTFNINSASALVYKGQVSSQFDNSTQNGYIAPVNGNEGLPAFLEKWISFNFTNNLPIQNSDYLLFQFAREEYSLFGSDNNFCTKYVQTTDSATNVISNIICDPATFNNAYNIDYNLNKTMFIKYSDNSIDYCWFDSTMQGYAICPNSKKMITSFWMHYTGTYRRVEYRLQLSTIVYLYNNDSTEIISALSNVSQAQVNTTTTIQNFNNYVSNTDTTQSNTNSTTALTGISNDFQQHLSGMNELTQFVFLPITFITSMIDNTCQPLVWDIPFVNTRVVVPCLSTIYSGYFGGIVGLFSTVMTALLTYRCVMKLLATIKGLLDAEDDKIEVIDL